MLAYKTCMIIKQHTLCFDGGPKQIWWTTHLHRCQRALTRLVDNSGDSWFRLQLASLNGPQRPNSLDTIIYAMYLHYQASRARYALWYWVHILSWHKGRFSVRRLLVLPSYVQPKQPLTAHIRLIQDFNQTQAIHSISRHTQADILHNTLHTCLCRCLLQATVLEGCEVYKPPRRWYFKHQ